MIVAVARCQPWLNSIVAGTVSQPNNWITRFTL